MPKPTNNPTPTATKGDAQLVNLAGEPATLPEGYRPHAVTARDYKGLFEIENANEAAGLHWFKPDTIRYFRTKLGRYHGAGVFTSSEIDPMGKRAFTVRVGDTEGNVATFGEFHAITDGRTATAQAKHLAALLTEGRTVIDSKGQTFTLAR